MHSISACSLILNECEMAFGFNMFQLGNNYDELQITININMLTNENLDLSFHFFLNFSC